jgi:DNA-binding NarL/FixJ family response regulator
MSHNLDLLRQNYCQPVTVTGKAINHALDMEIIGEAESAKEAIQLIRDRSPGLAIIDITLKRSSGLELIKGIKSLFIRVPILVLSMHDELLYAERALRAGATGYITKHQAADEVLLNIAS